MECAWWRNQSVFHSFCKCDEAIVTRQEKLPDEESHRVSRHSARCGMEPRRHQQRVSGAGRSDASCQQV